MILAIWRLRIQDVHSLRVARVLAHLGPRRPRERCKRQRVGRHSRERPLAIATPDRRRSTGNAPPRSRVATMRASRSSRSSSSSPSSQLSSAVSPWRCSPSLDCRTRRTNRIGDSNDALTARFVLQQGCTERSGDRDAEHARMRDQFPNTAPRPGMGSGRQWQLRHRRLLRDRPWQRERQRQQPIGGSAPSGLHGRSFDNAQQQFRRLPRRGSSPTVTFTPAASWSPALPAPHGSRPRASTG